MTGLLNFGRFDNWNDIFIITLKFIICIQGDAEIFGSIITGMLLIANEFVSRK